jgi:hypothetical protein
MRSGRKLLRLGRGGKEDLLKRKKFLLQKLISKLQFDLFFD